MLLGEVKAVFKVGELTMEALSLHAVVDQAKVFVLNVDLSDDCSPVGLQLCTSFVMAMVPLHFCKDHRVVKRMGHFSQGMIPSTLSLEELIEPDRHRVGGLV